MAVSRRPSKCLPAQAASSRRKPSSRTIGTGCSGTMGGFIRAIGLVATSSYLLQPGVEDAQHLVAGGCGRWCPALEQVAKEVLQVDAAASSRVRPWPARTPRPGEGSPGSSRWCCRSGSRPAGAARRSEAGWVRGRASWPDGSAAARRSRDGASFRMRPVEAARETELTSVSAVSSGVEPPAGIEPATPSLPCIGGQAPC
jgi:hypothetical protein